MPPGCHRQLPNHVEDEVWDVFTLPPGEQPARVAGLCRQHATHAETIRRLVLMIEQSGAARGLWLRREDGSPVVGDLSPRFGRRIEECRLVAEFLWRVLERVSADVAAVGNPDAVRNAAKLVLEVDLQERPAAATLLRAKLAGSPWLPLLPQ